MSSWTEAFFAVIIGIQAMIFFVLFLAFAYFLPIHIWEAYSAIREKILLRTNAKWRRHRQHLLGIFFFSADIRSLFQSGLMPAENFEERKWRLNQIVGRSQYRYHKLGLAYPKWIISFPPLDRKDLLANAYNKKNYFYRSVYNRSEEELTSVHKDENLKKFERYLGGART